MKCIINRFLSVTALLMLTIGARAGQTVTVHVTPNPNAGTVTESVNEKGVCTLTVTPAHGYFMTIDHLTAVTTLSGEAMQAPRRTIPISEGTPLTITPDAGNADPAGVTTYTFTMPEACYDVEVTADFREVPLIVGGVGVTSYNASKITGANITGIVSFNEVTNTLTLNGATIDMSTSPNGCPIESNIADLKVNLIGSNTLKPNVEQSSFFGFEYTDWASQGLLTFTHQNSPGKDGYGKLTIESGTITSSYTVTNTFTESEETGWVKFEENNTSVTYVEYYDLYIGNTQVKSSALTLFDGQVFFNPVTNTLALNNFRTSENISSGLADMTVALTGVNSVGNMTFSNGKAAVVGTIIIGKASNTEEELNKLMATTISGFGSVSVDEPLHVIQPSATPDWSTATNIVISDMVAYNLWVNGVQVTLENKNAIADGISFDGNQTLTLNNVNASLEKGSFIRNGLDKLTINLLGTNTIDCGNDYSFLVKDEGDNDHELTFTTSVNGAGSLTVTLNAENDWFDGHHTPTYENYLTFGSDISDGIQKIMIVAPSVDYGLKIGGTKVTNVNAANVLGNGTVSFDAVMNRLTLNTTSIIGDIEISRAELNIYLIGTSKMTGGFTLAEGSTDVKLVFASQGEADDKLMMNATMALGFDVTYSNKLRLDGTTISLPDDYGITIAGTSVTPTNRKDVLGDGKIVFDGNAKLILTDATINGKIVVTSEAQLLNNTLTVELVGTSKISNGNGVAIEYTGENMNVAFVTVGSAPGSLVYINTNEDPETVAPTLATAFSHCEVSFDQILTSAEDATGKTIIIGPSLDLIVTETNPVAESHFSEVMNVSTSTNNTVVDGWLYTMGDESTNPAEAGGFDNTTGQMVFTENSVMTGTTSTPEAKPGTPEYANQFKGATAMLPAGEHEIMLKDVVIAGGYDIMLKVGEQEEMSVRAAIEKADPSANSTNLNQNVTVDEVTLNVVCQESATAQIYIRQPESDDPRYKREFGDAPVMKIDRRIGPKSSVAAGLGGISVQSNAVQSAQGPANTYKSMEVSAMSSAMKSVIDAYSGFSCNDPDITDLPDNMFVKANTSSAPSRRAAVETILPEGLTFVDFSNTKITGMEVSRTLGAFNGVPENVFIYMPAGNTSKAKNVVIGGICDNMELDGSENAQPFRAMKNFKTAQVTLKRTFAEVGSGENKVRATIYLPFAISQEDADALGKFYEYDGINVQNEVDMTSVTTGGLKANKPYIFEAKEGGVTDPMVRVVDVLANPIETDGFKGVFERKNYEDGMYCYAAEAKGEYKVGQFVEMGPGSYVPPFRAYMVGDGAPSYAIAWDGVVDDIPNEGHETAIETVKTVSNVKTQEGWWTINGMRLNAQPKQAGMYVFNGRLVVVQ